MATSKKHKESPQDPSQPAKCPRGRPLNASKAAIVSTANDAAKAPVSKAHSTSASDSEALVTSADSTSSSGCSSSTLSDAPSDIEIQDATEALLGLASSLKKTQKAVDVVSSNDEQPLKKKKVVPIVENEEDADEEEEEEEEDDGV